MAPKRNSKSNNARGNSGNSQSKAKGKGTKPQTPAAAAGAGNSPSDQTQASGRATSPPRASKAVRSSEKRGQPAAPALDGLPAELLFDILDYVVDHGNHDTKAIPSYDHVLAVGRTCKALFRLALAAIARKVSLTNCTVAAIGGKAATNQSLSADQIVIRPTGIFHSTKGSSVHPETSGSHLMPLPADEIHSLDLFRVRSRGRGGPDNHQQALFIPAVRSLLSHATYLRSLTLSNYGTPTTLQAIIAMVAPQLASLSVNIDCGSHFTVLSSLSLPNVTRAKFEEALMCRIGSHMRNPSACVMDCRLPAMPKIEHLELTVSGMREVPLVQMLTGKDYPHLSELHVLCTNDELGGADDFGMVAEFDDDEDDGDDFGFGDPYFGGGIGGFGGMGGFGMGMGGFGGPRVRTWPQMSSLPTSFPSCMTKVQISALWADRFFQRVKSGPNVTHVMGGPLDCVLGKGFRKLTHVTGIEFDSPPTIPMSPANLPALSTLTSLDLNLISPNYALFQASANAPLASRLLPNLESLLAGTPTVAAFLHVFRTPKLRKLMLTTNSDAFRTAPLARHLLERLDTPRTTAADEESDHRRATFRLTLPPMLESLASIIVEDHSVVELAGDDVLARLTRLETYQCRGRPLTYLSKCMALQSLTLHMSVHDGPVGESAAGEGATFRFEYGRIVRVPPPSMTGSGSADMPPTQVQVVIPPGGLPELRTIELIGPNDAEKTMTDSVLVIPPGTLTALSRCTKLVQVTPRGYVWAGPAWGIANRQAPAWELVLNPGMVDQVEKANGFKMALRGLARVPWTVRPSSVTLQVPGEVDMQIMAKWIEAVAEVQVWATGFKTASGSKRCALPMSTAAGFGLADFGVNDGSVSIDERQKQWWGESKEIGAVPKLNIVYA